jgi:cytochrome P450
MNNAIPTVRGQRLLGSLPEMRRDQIGLLKRIPLEYGDIARLRIGLIPATVLSGADLCHEVLTEKPEAFIKGFGLSMFARPLLGDGLLTSEGDVHKKNRRLVAPAFVHSRIAGYASIIAECVEAHVTRLAKLSEADLSVEMMRLTLDVVARTLFGAELGTDLDAIGAAFTDMLEHVNAEILSVVPMPPVVPTPANRRLLGIVRELDEIVYRIIRERRRSGTDANDLLSLLLAARDPEDGSAFTDEEIRDEVMTILIAGHETTANGLAWTFSLLHEHPGVRQRLEAESDAVLGGRRPTLQDLAELPVAARVFKESLRLFPPAYLVSRRAVRDVTIGGHEIRKGALVIVNIVGMHHRADYFPEPGSFLPDRFDPAAERVIPRHAFLPFGAGPRVCIGNHFALMEGQMALAQLAGRLRFERRNPGAPLVGEPLLTLRPRGGVPVKIRRRACSAAVSSAILAP